MFLHQTKLFASIQCKATFGPKRAFDASLRVVSFVWTNTNTWETVVSALKMKMHLKPRRVLSKWPHEEVFDLPTEKLQVCVLLMRHGIIRG